MFVYQLSRYDGGSSQCLCFDIQVRFLPLCFLSLVGRDFLFFFFFLGLDSGNINWYVIFFLSSFCFVFFFVVFFSFNLFYYCFDFFF